MPREHEWDSRWWSPDHQRRAPARCARRAGIIDLTAFAIFDIVGPGRARRGAAHLRRAVRRRRSAGSIYTPVLDAKGGFRSDLTVMRLGDDHFRVVTGGAHGMADRKWFADHLPADGAARRRPAPTAFTTIGLWGPRARDILGRAHRRRRLPRGLRRSCTCREIERRRRSTVLASRISYVGELGWELYVADGAGRRGCGTLLLEAGAPHGAVPVGIGVYGTTGRIEKGYRAYGSELDGERTHRRGRHAAAEGQGRRLRRPRGLPRAARRRRRRRCCAR